MPTPLRPSRAVSRTSEAGPPADVAGAGPDADPETVARTILLGLLATRARSRAELAARLAARGVPEEVATRLLDRFAEVGLVDDHAFARAWVEGRRATKGLARRALAHELRGKGVTEEAARAALAEVDSADEEAAARRLVRRRLASMHGLDEAVAARRLAAMLARKGYGGEVAYRVVREELRRGGDPTGA